MLKEHIDVIPKYGQAFLSVLEFFVFGEILRQIQFAKRFLKGSQELLALGKIQSLMRRNAGLLLEIQ